MASHWTTEEDLSLESAAAAVPAGSADRWRAVAESMGGRKCAKDCKDRFEELRACKRARHNATTAKGKGGRSRGDKGGGHHKDPKGKGEGAAPPLAEAHVLAEAAPGAMELDGKLLEGGGQVIRQSIALAALLGVPIVVRNIRGGRDRPGLQRQHCTGVDLVGKLCGARVVGCGKDSSTLAFSPGLGKPQMRPKMIADTMTAGAIMLLQQVALPVALFAAHPLELELRGGTNATFAPQIDYAQHVFLPILTRCCGVNVQLAVRKRGFFPKGQGVAILSVTPTEQITSFDLIDRGVVAKLKVITFGAGRFRSCAATIAAHVKVALGEWPDAASVEVEVVATEETNSSAFGDGFGVVIIAETSTGCILAGSEIGSTKPGADSAEQVADVALQMLRTNLDQGGCVDEYLQDQLIIFMALAAGKSKVLMGPLSLHTQTAIHFAREMTGAMFEINDNPEGTVLVECEGIGFQRVQ